MKAWILIGMMGAGKSTVGKRLAEMSQREFIDTDQLIVNRLGKSIDKIFEQYGEQTFRDHETSIIKSLQSGAVVVSTGGGSILRSENLEALRLIGITVYLRVPKEQLIERLKISRKKRPLLQRDDWEDAFGALFDQRAAVYEQCDIIVDIDNASLDESAERLYKELINE
jgi:shikimate kinase